MAFVVDAEGLPVCAICEHVVDGPRDGTDFCPCPESILPVNGKFVVYSGATGVEKDKPLVRLAPSTASERSMTGVVSAETALLL